MSLKNKQTYGDYYWGTQVEAAKFLNEESEKAIAPYLKALLADIPRIPEMPSGIQNMLDAMTEPPDFAFLPYLIGVGVNAVDEALDVAFDPVFKMLKRAQNKSTRETWLTSAEANILWSRNKITEGLWDEIIATEGYEDVLGSSLYESQLPYPTIPDMVLYSRYHGDADAPWGEFQDWYNISPREWPVWKWLSLQRLTTLDVRTLFRRNVISQGELYDKLAKIGWPREDRMLVEELGWTIPNAMLLTQGLLQRDESTDMIIKSISKADIHPEYAQTYLDGILTKPASIDLVAYELRQDPELSGLPQQLKRIGIHPDYFHIYKELAYQIPPVADIITMAVREAFSPDIAAKFGQYDDFPEPFAEWAGKKGLSQEWAERYWAAHWALPSPLQGFEMLHRGIIDNEELNLLLRALDIMPFWRKRLTQMAYKRLTRVDVRRMYRVGVLSESEVYEAYLELGYDEKRAKQMSLFTIRQTLSILAGVSTKDVVRAYANRTIDRGEARSILIEFGVRSEDVSYILSTADYKREWEYTDTKIRGIRNLYKKGEYSDDQARDQLSKLDLPAEQITALMEQWYFEEKETPPRTWTTAQTLAFIKAELITKERGERELELLKYDSEHRDVYMKSLE